MSRVLMVDDAGLFRMLETSFLRRLGWEILRAHDSADLIRKATDAAPSVILLDSQRAGLDGPECVRALKSDPVLRSIPVLVVAAGDDLKTCSEAGADATLTRPFRPGALEMALSSLGQVTQRRGPRRSARGWVQVAGPGGQRRARLKDISRTGLFLALSEPLPLAARIAVSLRLHGPDGERSLRAQGVVVRQVMLDPDSHLIPGVGVRFVEIDPQDENTIDHYVNDATTEAGIGEDASGAGTRDD